VSSGRDKLGAAFILTLTGSALVLVSGVIVLTLYLTLTGRALEGVGLPAVALRTVRSLEVLVALVTVMPGALGLTALRAHKARPPYSWWYTSHSSRGSIPTPLPRGPTSWVPHSTDRRCASHTEPPSLLAG